MARRLRTRLEAQGATVVMTRANDRGAGPCITRRVKIGHAARPAVAASDGIREHRAVGG